MPERGRSAQVLTVRPDKCGVYPQHQPPNKKFENGKYAMFVSSDIFICEKAYPGEA
jgi:hypothetical protein